MCIRDRFIADKELSAETRFVPKMLNQTGKPFTNKIAVIGLSLIHI